MKAMDVGQRPGSEIQQKNHVERAIIMAIDKVRDTSTSHENRTCNYHGGGNGNADAAGNAYYAETADPCEGCPHD